MCDLPVAQPCGQERTVFRRTFKPGIGGGVLAFEEHGVKNARVNHGVEVCAFAVGNTVHWPGIQKIRVGGEVFAGVNVPVLCGHHGAVILAVIFDKGGYSPGYVVAVGCG